MRRLWGRMAALYGGARWASAASALPERDDGRPTLAADTWAAALSGLSVDQISEGLRACLAANDEFVPTPHLFRQRCLGVPSLAFVRLALRGGGVVDPTPFVRLVWAKLDRYAWARADAGKAERMVADAYQLAVEHVTRGGDLPADPVAVVEHQAEPRTPSDPATARAHLDAIAALLGAGPAPGPAEGRGSSPGAADTGSRAAVCG